MALKNYRSIGKILIILSRRGAVRRLDIGGQKYFYFFGGSVEQGGAFFLGLPQISNLWEEEEVRLLYTKRVLLVATSHFRRSP